MNDPKKDLMFYGLTISIVSVAALLSAYVLGGRAAAPGTGTVFTGNVHALNSHR